MNTEKQNILIIGGDGYLGWPTAMYLSKKGHRISLIDNFSKRRIEVEEGVAPMWPILTLQERTKIWKNLTGININLYAGDLLNEKFLYQILEAEKPDSIIHYGEQPSAPYSMKSLSNASFTQHNNVIGNLNLLFAMKSKCPDAHLIKLGTMGEYGQPNIDIEEGYIEITHNGRKDNFLYPKNPGSFYHLSKVHDTNNIYFACKIWGLRSTDLNQGVVYGIDTDETLIDERLKTSFHYDDVFGTVLNRFCVQAAIKKPFTVYGNGSQTRTYLNIMDTLRCIEIAVNNCPEAGELKIYNQFTETFSVIELAQKVQEASKELGLNIDIECMENPRIEKEDHYYNAKNNNLISLGLDPILLNKTFLISTIRKIIESKHLINQDMINPKIKWKLV
tara:strand:- start:22513 stop:23682 length:1170 start_codon:yes stop_codon:yes gene_type:complete